MRAQDGHPNAARAVDRWRVVPSVVAAAIDLYAAPDFALDFGPHSVQPGAARVPALGRGVRVLAAALARAQRSLQVRRPNAWSN